MRYLDAVTITQLKGLRLFPKNLANSSEMAGAHKNPVRGFSRDFFQHRPYVPGDDPRTLDWKVYARLDRFYVREFESENLFTSQIILDQSRSMIFHSDTNPPKWDYACRLAMAISWLALSQGDALGLMTVSSGIGIEVPPRSGFPRLEILDARLSEISPQGLSSPETALPMTASHIKKRSLIILISDLMGNTEEFIKGIVSLKTGRNEVIVFHVIDPRERDLNFEAPVVFQGMEEAGEVAVGDQEFRLRYAAEFEKQIKTYQSAFHQNQISHQLFTTDRPLEESLRRFLRKSALKAR